MSHHWCFCVENCIHSLHSIAQACRWSRKHVPKQCLKFFKYRSALFVMSDRDFIRSSLESFLPIHDVRFWSAPRHHPTKGAKTNQRNQACPPWKAPHAIVAGPYALWSKCRKSLTTDAGKSFQSSVVRRLHCPKIQTWDPESQHLVSPPLLDLQVCGDDLARI